MDVNLLAGRALDRRFFPLVYPEWGSGFNLERILMYGGLPGVVKEEGLQAELLESYVSTYLKEEIQQEALVKNLDSFARFLKVAATLNGSIIDATNTSRECHAGRRSVSRYFDTLVDTLIAFRLPAFQARIKVKERVRPKFYLFDCGVARALASRTRSPLSDRERDILFETYVLHELRAAQSYLNTAGELSYYGSERSEVDIILSVGGEHFGFEVKSADRWRPEFNRTLLELLESRKIRAAFGIYLGTEKLQSGKITIFPIREFLEKLWKGDFT